jgi:hypothetical protein
MSTFSDRFTGCLSGKNLPAPLFESANEALEFIHKAHSAIEALGFNPEVTLAEFAAAAVAAGLFGPAVGAALAEGAETAGEVLVVTFLAACVACMSFALAAAARDFFAANLPEPFVQQQLAALGMAVDTTGAGTAVG